VFLAFAEWSVFKAVRLRMYVGPPAFVYAIHGIYVMLKHAGVEYTKALLLEYADAVRICRCYWNMQISTAVYCTACTEILCTVDNTVY
jgi:hypothetical protein